MGESSPNLVIRNGLVLPFALMSLECCREAPAEE